MLSIAHPNGESAWKHTGAAEELARAYLMVMNNGFMSGAVLDVDGGGLL
ncbi:hypothetical protein [Rugamonas rubra]|uniref:Enoyl-(Acyl carrier protein) reductase n=1 Tax=Rugamonas rubra TaxID=758825 RepID=A0A1I4M9F7_9BURK|nr:hypothetical protein [Rugamonas rubra]SFL99760.1 hypothetical protein SAMN02982985_02335 [Rugamonas rubra]